MFIQQLIGTINLALPAIILFQFYPDGVFGLYGMIILSILTGVYVRYLNKKSAHTMVASLLYRPTGDYADAFRHLISECEIDPKTITINYAYTNQVVAMTIFTTLIIDPLVWSSVEEDPEALKVKEIYDKAIEPKLSLIQKKRLHEIKQALTPGAQRFIFKHELAHAYYNFSGKQLMMLATISSVATFTVLCAAYLAFMHFSGIAAIIAGIGVGMITDILLTYGSNLVFKSRHEKLADSFAQRYSSHEDILEAANFFEHHQTILDSLPDPTQKLSFLPSIILTGHPNGRDRADYLRKK